MTNKNVSDRKIEHVKDVQGKMHNSNLVTHPDNKKSSDCVDPLVDLYVKIFGSDKKTAEEGINCFKESINNGLMRSCGSIKNLSDDKMNELIDVLFQCDKKIFIFLKSDVDDYVNLLVKFLNSNSSELITKKDVETIFSSYIESKSIFNNDLKQQPPFSATVSSQPPQARYQQQVAAVSSNRDDSPNLNSVKVFKNQGIQATNNNCCLASFMTILSKSGIIKVLLNQLDRNIKAALESKDAVSQDRFNELKNHLKKFDIASKENSLLLMMV